MYLLFLQQVNNKLLPFQRQRRNLCAGDDIKQTMSLRFSFHLYFAHEHKRTRYYIYFSFLHTDGNRQRANNELATYKIYKL